MMRIIIANHIFSREKHVNVYYITSQKRSGSYLLQDFQSESDQFGTLCIKRLKENDKNNRLICCTFIVIQTGNKNHQFDSIEMSLWLMLLTLDRSGSLT